MYLTGHEAADDIDEVVVPRNREAASALEHAGQLKQVLCLDVEDEHAAALLLLSLQAAAHQVHVPLRSNNALVENRDLETDIQLNLRKLLLPLNIEYKNTLLSIREEVQ